MVVTILLLTLWPLPEQAYRASLSPVTCLVCGDQGLQDVFQNILMLLPLGVFLGLAGIGPARAGLVGFALSFLVEALQYTVVTGRDASLSDVVTNTAGTVLGAMLAPHLPVLLRPSRPAAARLAIAMVLLWSAAWMFGAWALEGHIGAGNWRGRFPGDMPDAPALSGTAVQATVDGAALGAVPVSLPPEVEQRFARDTFDLRVVIEPAAPVAPRENVVTLIDVAPDNRGNNSLVLMLNRVGPRALLSYRINASSVRLRTPSFSFGPAFGVPEGHRATLQVGRARGILRGVADRDGQPLNTEYRIAPELLWSVLVPRTPHPGAEWRVEPFLWAAALLAIAGYWAGKSRSRGAFLITFAWVIAVQAVTPRFFPVAEQSLLGWAMLLGGIMLGVLAGRQTQKGPHPKMRAFQRA
jgi:hypothetical protein